MRRQRVEVALPEDLDVTDLDRVFATKAKFRSDGNHVVLCKSPAGGPYRIKMIDAGSDSASNDHLAITLRSDGRGMLISPHDFLSRLTVGMFCAVALFIFVLGALPLAIGDDHIGQDLIFMGIGVLVAGCAVLVRWATRLGESADATLAAQLMLDRARSVKVESSKHPAEDPTSSMSHGPELPR